MIFTVRYSGADDSLKHIYEDAMGELGKFFEFDWNENRPHVYIVEDIRVRDALWRKSVPKYVVGWTKGVDVFILNKEVAAKVSKWRNGQVDVEYRRLLKHELVHVFTKVYTGIFDRVVEPDWLWEGLAIYLSGQNNNGDADAGGGRVFENFLDHYSADNSGVVYEESGRAVEFLVENFGKRKLLTLLKKLKEVHSEREFAKVFEDVYGFELAYEIFRDLK